MSVCCRIGEIVHAHTRCEAPGRLRRGRATASQGERATQRRPMAGSSAAGIEGHPAAAPHYVASNMLAMAAMPRSMHEHASALQNRRDRAHAHEVRSAGPASSWPSGRRAKERGRHGEGRRRERFAETVTHMPPLDSQRSDRDADGDAINARARGLCQQHTLCTRTHRMRPCWASIPRPRRQCTRCRWARSAPART